MAAHDQTRTTFRTAFDPEAHPLQLDPLVPAQAQGRSLVLMAVESRAILAVGALFWDQWIFVD
jgi:hypothetical protein